MESSALNANTVVYILILVVITFCVVAKGGTLSITECEPTGQIHDGRALLTFTCKGFLGNDKVQWLIRYNETQSISILCEPNKDCTERTAGVNASRPTPSTSVLTVQRTYWESQGYPNIICSSVQNSTNLYTCSKSANPQSTTPQPSSTQGAASYTSTTTRSNQGSSATSSTNSGEQSKGPSTMSSTTSEEQSKAENDNLPVAAIAGGVAAAVAVIIVIIIIIVIVVVKRRKERKAISNGHANNDAGEDHVNPLYGREGDPAQASPANGQPAGLALMLPAQDNYSSPAPSKPKPAAANQRSDDGLDVGYASVAFEDQQQAASPSAGQSSGGPSPQTSAAPQDKAPTCVTDSDMYIAMDGPGLRRGAENADEEKADAGYSTVGISSGPPSASAPSAIPSKTAPSGDVYAVVQKSGPMAKSSASNGPADTAAEGADNTYAVVDKSRSNAPASSAGNASPNDLSPNNADNTYAVVDKSRSTSPTSSSTAGNALSRGYAANSAYVFVGKSSPSKNGAASFTTAGTTGQASSGDVYAQVDKSAKQGRQALNGDGGEESSQSAPVYAQVNKQPKGENTSTIQTQNGKPKPPTKPKPAVKPKPGTNGFE